MANPNILIHQGEIQHSSDQFVQYSKFENESLRLLGFKVTPYSGNIPLEVFKNPLNVQEKNPDTTGSQHQIYIEPDLDICHKTIIVDPSIKPMSSATTNYADLPGYIQEGIFLSAVQKYNLAGIPKFIEFTELPDGRVAISEQYLKDTLKVPDDRRGNEMANMTTGFIMSILQALEPLCNTFDELHKLNLSVAANEIHHNLRMSTVEGRVNEIWLTDFERYFLQSAQITDDRVNPLYMGTTIYGLCLDALKTRIENIEMTVDHPVIQYLNFALFNLPSEKGWNKPLSNTEMINQVLTILNHQSFDEFGPKYMDHMEELLVGKIENFIMD